METAKTGRRFARAPSRDFRLREAKTKLLTYDA